MGPLGPHIYLVITSPVSECVTGIEIHVVGRKPTLDTWGNICHSGEDGSLLNSPNPAKKHYDLLVVVMWRMITVVSAPLVDLMDPRVVSRSYLHLIYVCSIKKLDGS